MKILITNVHPDDGLRVKNACEACGHWADLVPPGRLDASIAVNNPDLIITFDGPWYDQIRSQWKIPVITVLGNNWLMAGHWRKEFERGRRWIVFKEPLLYWSWPDDRKAILPFVQEEAFSPVDDCERKPEINCYIHAYQHRFQAACAKANQICELIGMKSNFYGDGGTGGILNQYQAASAMRKSRWTIHIKHEGYMCNAPIKSLIHGTPVITDFETIKQNSAWSYLIPGVTCVAHDDPAMIAQMVKGMSDTDWRHMSTRCAGLGDRFNHPLEPWQLAYWDKFLERAAKEGE